MSEDGDMWRQHHADRQAKRHSNRVKSTDRLTKLGFKFESKNGGAHLLMRTEQFHLDFWPGTGKWIARHPVPKESRGVRELEQYLLQYCTE